MTQWLQSWGAPTMAMVRRLRMAGWTIGDMDMGGMTVAGMMSAEDMDEPG